MRANQNRLGGVSRSNERQTKQFKHIVPVKHAPVARVNHNLPTPLTRFIGRAREIASETKARAHAPLKHENDVPAYQHGVWWVELASL
jgi:hypothetical protein